MDRNNDRTAGSFYLQVPPPVALSESLNKSLPSLHSATQSPSSIRSSLDPSSAYWGGMTTMASCDNKGNEDYHRTLSTENHRSFNCHQANSFCETVDLHERAGVENTYWQTAWKEQKSRAETAEFELKKIEEELEDLTLSLFTEANQLVANEKRARMDMEMKLKQACLQLDAEKSRSSSNSRPMPPPLYQPTLQSSEFELFFEQLLSQPFQKLHGLPFMKACLKFDIVPCLKMTEGSDAWIKKWLHTLLHHPCYIEDRKQDPLHDRPKRQVYEKSELQKDAELEYVCVGCYKPMARSPYRFRWTPQDPWQWMDVHCRNRSVAVCNFYSFLRNMKLHLMITGMMILPLLISLLFPMILCYNGDTHTGLILLSENRAIRSGVLSADHLCQEYPEKFPARRIANRGTVHCTIWTEPKCQGSLFIIPAHYEVDSPSGISFKSVIC
ncbi:hypothetical protein [Absidia glauca]|uniref:GDP/GTP exchange factor Sec2 N-terminal domain-containing protein n=1 Tax=Absidia glauca TaxID=4829 RepID=A0A168L919_ABSGL|nr:hypothetical protein [Absidia glauca]